MKELTGTQVTAPDLRAGAALVLAGLAAEGHTIVEDIKFILRGYEDFAEKLQSLGGEIKLIRDERELQKSRMMIG